MEEAGNIGNVENILTNECIDYLVKYLPETKEECLGFFPKEVRKQEYLQKFIDEIH